MRALLLLAGLAALPAFGQEPAPAERSEHGSGHGDPMLPYKFLNFAVLAGGLGYIFVKAGVPALRGQQSAIAENLAVSAQRAEEAAREAAQIEARIANLDADLAGIRAKAKEDLDAEAGRLAREAEAHLARVEHAATLEIEAAAKAARGELKAYGAGLALTLAAEKLRTRLDAPAQARLASEFIQRLEAQR